MHERRARQEFGVDASLASVGQLYRRRARERRQAKQETLQALLASEMAEMARTEGRD